MAPCIAVTNHLVLFATDCLDQMRTIMCTEPMLNTLFKSSVSSRNNVEIESCFAHILHAKPLKVRAAELVARIEQLVSDLFDDRSPAFIERKAAHSTQKCWGKTVTDLS